VASLVVLLYPTTALLAQGETSCDRKSFAASFGLEQEKIGFELENIGKELSDLSQRRRYVDDQLFCLRFPELVEEPSSIECQKGAKLRSLESERRMLLEREKDIGTVLLLVGSRQRNLRSQLVVFEYQCRLVENAPNP
jgi:hypothetical protein